MRHGNHPIAAEGSVLRLAAPVVILLALFMRLAAELRPDQALVPLDVSAFLWIVGWLVWGGSASRYLARVRPSDSSTRVVLRKPEISQAPPRASQVDRIGT